MHDATPPGPTGPPAPPETLGTTLAAGDPAVPVEAPVAPTPPRQVRLQVVVDSDDLGGLLRQISDAGLPALGGDFDADVPDIAEAADETTAPAVKPDRVPVRPLSPAALVAIGTLSFCAVLLLAWSMGIPWVTGAARGTIAAMPVSGLLFAASIVLMKFA
jgi:hypothetical protein